MPKAGSPLSDACSGEERRSCTLGLRASAAYLKPLGRALTSIPVAPGRSHLLMGVNIRRIDDLPARRQEPGLVQGRLLGAEQDLDRRLEPSSVAQLRVFHLKILLRPALVGLKPQGRESRPLIGTRSQVSRGPQDQKLQNIHTFGGGLRPSGRLTTAPRARSGRNSSRFTTKDSPAPNRRLLSPVLDSGSPNPFQLALALGQASAFGTNGGVADSSAKR